jgi:hypothetical protein
LHRGALLSQFLRQACRDRAGATHITDTNSTHEIHKDQPQLVIDAIREVVDAVRCGATQLLPRFEPAPCPKLPGPKSELRLPRRTGKSKPADRSHNSAHGLEIPCALTGEAGRSRCLSGRRAGRHRPPGGQWAHRCRFRPRRGHPGGEPKRGTMFSEPALTCASMDDLAGAILGLRFYSEATQARPFDRDGGLPPRTRRHRRRP